MADVHQCAGCKAKAEGKGTLLGWLSATPAQEAGVPGAVVCVASNESLADAMLQMDLHGVLCLPVVNMTTSQVIGFVDMNDIVAFVVDNTRQYHKSKGEAAISVEKLLADWAMPNLVKTQLEKVCNYSGANAFHFLPPTATVWDVIELMNGKHVHRVAIVEQSGRLAGLVTQSTLVKFLAVHKSEINTLLGAKVSKMAGATAHMVVAVHDDKTAFVAFDLLRKEKVSAVAVVDSAGRLKTVLSNRDLKQIGHSAQGFDNLYKKVYDYLHGEQPWRKFRDLFAYSVVSYTSDDTFGQVLERFVKNRVHRLYLVDDNTHPSGVFSLGDLIRLVRHHALHPTSSP